jgi:hypothetical protein
MAVKDGPFRPKSRALAGGRRSAVGEPQDLLTADLPTAV